MEVGVRILRASIAKRVAMLFGNPRQRLMLLAEIPCNSGLASYHYDRNNHRPLAAYKEVATIHEHVASSTVDHKPLYIDALRKSMTGKSVSIDANGKTWQRGRASCLLPWAVLEAMPFCVGWGRKTTRVISPQYVG